MRFGPRWITIAMGMTSGLVACGGGDNDTPIAQQSKISLLGATVGPTPFIQIVQIDGADVSQLASVEFTIAAKPNTVSKPVHVKQSRAYLSQRGYAQPGSVALKIPVFGLYAGHANFVTFDLQFVDGSRTEFSTSLTTPAYVDPNAVYDHVNILKTRSSARSLPFDFFYLKSALGTPVVVDTDGEVRWIGVTESEPSATATFRDGGFIVGDAASLAMTRIELDGSTTKTAVTGAPMFTEFHHNIDPGKTGLLAEFDATLNGVPYLETILAEITTTGAVVADWDFGQILGDYMSSQGDDPTLFIRPGTDWFHMNASLYDPSDDSVIASSRENFLIKVDHQTKEIIWIFGDPTKYWHSFPSLRAKALTLAAGGLYPIGQHSISITPDRKLMLFNNGYPSFRQPSGAPSGDSRTYSAVSAYVIDGNGMAATEAWRFDYGQSIRSDICSSAVQSTDGSLLINYSAASGWTKSRIVGLDPTHDVVFDFEFPTVQCQTSFNAQVFSFEALNL